MNKTVRNSVINNLDSRTYLQCVDNNIITGTKEEITKKRFDIMLNYDDVDVSELDLSQITKEDIKMSTFYHNYAFNNDAYVINVDKIDLKNMDQIRTLIDNKKICDSIEKVLGVLVTYEYLSRLCGLKIGIKMNCIVYLKINNPQSDVVQSIKMDSLTKMSKSRNKGIVNDIWTVVKRLIFN